jgi:hypothetical protein
MDDSLAADSKRFRPIANEAFPSPSAKNRFAELDIILGAARSLAGNLSKELSSVGDKLKLRNDASEISSIVSEGDVSRNLADDSDSIFEELSIAKSEVELMTSEVLILKENKESILADLQDQIKLSSKSHRELEALKVEHDRLLVLLAEETGCHYESIAIVNSQLEDALHALAFEKSANDLLIEERVKLISELREVMRVIEDKENAFDALKLENESLKVYIEATRLSLREAQNSLISQLEEAKREVADEQKANELLREECKKIATVRHTSIDESMKALMDEKTDLSKACIDLKAAKAEADLKLAALIADVADSQENYRNEVNMLQTKFDDLATQYEKLVEVRKAEKEEFEMEFATLQKAKNETDTIICRLDEAQSRLKSELDIAEQMIIREKTAQTRLREEIEAFKLQFDETSRALTSEKSVNDLLVKDTQSIRNDLDKTKLELEEARRALDYERLTNSIALKDRSTSDSLDLDKEKILLSLAKSERKFINFQTRVANVIESLWFDLNKGADPKNMPHALVDIVQSVRDSVNKVLLIV